VGKEQRGVLQVVNVLLADDEALVRDLIQELLETDTRFRVVAAVGSAEDAAEAASQHKPQLAIIDVRMPGGGRAAAQAIREISPDTVIVACSSFDDRHTRDSMEQAGAQAYVLKGSDDVLEIARQVLGLA
jgi:DNA-binding NarL/FixJ family response regulator